MFSQLTPEQQAIYTKRMNLANNSPILATQGYSLADRLYNTVSGQPATSLGEQVSKPVLETLQPIVNILTILQSGYFWLNAGGIIIGIIVVVIALQALMKQEIIGSIKKSL